MIKQILVLSLSFYALQATSQNIMAQAELEAENIKEVRVEGFFVDVYVNRGDKVYFKGVIEGNGDEDDYRFDTDISGSSLIIKVIYTKNKYNWRDRKITKSRIDITITDGVQLDIDNSSGDVNVANLRASESRIEASSGDITLKSIIANLEVETSSGDIEIDGLVGDSEIESTSGEQDLNDIQGTIQARASSGDISISNFEGNLELKATSGDIEIRNGEGKLEIRTTSGEIDGDNITLTGDARFDATSGNIEMDFTNDLTDLSFFLTATSGNLEVGSQSGEKRLVIDRGGYKVEGVTSSGSQEYE